MTRSTSAETRHESRSSGEQHATLTTFGLGVSIAMMHGSAAFTQEFHTYDLPFASKAIATGDFNQDGAMDIALSGNWEFCVLLNNGDGTLGDPVAYPSNVPRDDIAIADFNLDGFPDVVVSGGSRFAVHLNDGTGQFVPGETVTSMDPYYAVAAGDLDGDELPDIVVVGEDSGGWGEGIMDWYRNMGDGSWELAHTEYVYPRAGGYLLGVEVGDLDDDGDLDVATSGEGFYDGYYVNDRGFHIFRNMDGQGTSWSVQNKDSRFGGDFDGPTREPALGDIDSDGDTDVICVIQSYSTLYIMTTLNNGSGGFGIVRTVQSIQGADSGQGAFATIVDHDNDGDLDIAYVGPDSRFGLWLVRNDDWQGFTNVRYSHPFSDSMCQHIATADITGDGAIDWLINPGSKLVVVENTTPQAGAVLSAGPLVCGQEASISLTSGRPGRWAYFVWSPLEPGHTNGLHGFGGITLNLQTPIRQFASRQIDANGEVAFEQLVPAGFQFDTMSLQAIVRNGANGSRSGKSNVVFAPVVD